MESNDQRRYSNQYKKTGRFTRNEHAQTNNLWVNWSRRSKIIYMRAIIENLVEIQNSFLRNILTTPIGKCEPIKFLQGSRNHNVVIDTKIQRSLAVVQGQGIIYNLRNIEGELAKRLIIRILSFLELILCFIKRASVGARLSSLARDNNEFKNIWKLGLKLKNII
nr:7898_t:CDS:2 [Entrophospora candida]